MKRILFLLLLLPTLVFADAVIFSGNDVKALKQNLDLFGVVKVMSGNVDPSAGAGVAAPVGSAYLSTTDGLFLKTGVANTDWTKNSLLPVDLTADVTGILPIANGGTGISTTPTNGKLLIGNGTGYTSAGLTGTVNQVNVTDGAGSITLSLPQDIATTSNVQFANLTATGTTTLNTSLTGPLKSSSGVVSASAVNLTTEVSGVLPVANGGTGSSTQNFVDLTTNQTVAGEKTFSNTVKADSIQTTGSSGVQIKNSAGTNVADFGPAGTTNASIVGGLNVGGNLLVTGTATASNLSGTNTGDDTIGSQVAGSIGVFKDLSFPNNQIVETNSATKQFGIDNGNKNELYNGNFEAETLAVGWTISNATSSAETTNEFEGLKTLSLSLTGALSLSQSSTINAARKSGVQMVASLWVKSDDVSDLQLCSLKNGAEDKCTVTGGYVQGSGWRQLTISFLGDSTSNGLKLKSTDTTGTVLVDQAFVGIGSPIVDFTPDMVYSAAVGSTGIVTQENTDWINGNCSVVSNVFTCNLKSGEFSSAPNCVLTTNQGSGSGNGAAGAIDSTSSTTAVFRTYATTTAASIALPTYLICQKQGADYKTSKAYVASGSVALNTTVYSAYVTSTGTISVENTDWLSGCTNANPVVCTFTIGIFTTAPNCWANSGEIASYDAYQTVTSNSTTVTIQSGNWLAGVANTTSRRNFYLYCQKTGADYTAAFNPVIVGSFQGYNETPGVSRVETFSVSYGTTNATTVCSASPCSYLDQIGNAVTSVTRSSTGTYAANFSKTYSKLKCALNALSPSGTGAIPYGSSPFNVSCANCSSLAFASIVPSTGSYTDSFGTFVCQGIPQ